MNQTPKSTLDVTRTPQRRLTVQKPLLSRRMSERLLTLTSIDRENVYETAHARFDSTDMRRDTKMSFSLQNERLQGVHPTSHFMLIPKCLLGCL